MPTSAPVTISYTGTGSGAGQKSVEGATPTSDFAGSDAAMKDEELAALPAGKRIVHVPTAMGAVVVIYSLPGVSDLNLGPETLAGIFLGTITTWNDPQIAADNANEQLSAEYNLAYLDFLELRHEQALAGLAHVRDEARLVARGHRRSNVQHGGARRRHRAPVAHLRTTHGRVARPVGTSAIRPVAVDLGTGDVRVRAR